ARPRCLGRCGPDGCRRFARRHLAHPHAEEVGTQRVHDREDEEPQQHQEADAQHEQHEFAHGRASRRLWVPDPEALWVPDPAPLWVPEPAPLIWVPDPAPLIWVPEPVEGPGTTRKTSSVRPMVKAVSGESAASRTFCPSIFVPLVEPRSRSMARSPSQRISAWRRLEPASAIVMPASPPRPITVRALVSGWRRPSTSTTACHETVLSTDEEFTRTVP